jgi:hypothetical protein
MYRSPVEALVTDIQHQIDKEMDEEIYKAVVSVGINVDKDELIRALAYDRHRYAKGHFDGVADATPRWIPVTERLPEMHTKVLCCGIRGGRFIAELSSWGHENHLYWTKRDGKGCSEPTHWMPLPEPPKGE